MKAKLFKYYFYIMAALAFATLALFTIFPTTESFIVAVTIAPKKMMIPSILVGFWCLFLVPTSLVLLFSEATRNKVFLFISNTKVRDELEIQAVNDAIKRTFMFNLTLIAFAFSASGFFYTSHQKTEGKTEYSYGYTIAPDQFEELDHEKISLILDKLGPAYDDKVERYKAALKEVTEQDTKTLIPKRVFSPYGALWFIVLQFLAFRFFLFLNRRALQ